jgi:hypothetical protein
MNTTVLRHVRQLFNVEYMPRHVNRNNQKKWVRSVRQLGDRWLLAKPVERKIEQSIRLAQLQATDKS